MAALDEPGRGGGVEVSPERHDEDVGVEGPGVGLDAPGRRIDRPDRRLHEPHPGLDDVRDTGDATAAAGRAPEHDIELREPEDETVALIDQDDIGVVTELVGQPGRQLQAAEPRAQHHNSHGREDSREGTGRPTRGNIFDTVRSSFRKPYPGG